MVSLIEYNVCYVGVKVGFRSGCVSATGGRRTTGPDVGRGVERQMDGRETKANNFALLYTCIGRR